MELPKVKKYFEVTIWCYHQIWLVNDDLTHLSWDKVAAILKMVCWNAFLNENIWISNKISLKYVPWGLIDNMSALVQTMAWHRPGDKPLSEPMLIQFTDAYMQH